MSIATICRFIFFLVIGLVYLGVGFPFADILIGVSAVILAILEVVNR